MSTLRDIAAKLDWVLNEVGSVSILVADHQQNLDRMEELWLQLQSSGDNNQLLGDIRLARESLEAASLQLRRFKEIGEEWILKTTTMSHGNNVGSSANTGVETEEIPTKDGIIQVGTSIENTGSSAISLTAPHLWRLGKVAARRIGWTTNSPTTLRTPKSSIGSHARTQMRLRNVSRSMVIQTLDKGTRYVDRKHLGVDAYILKDSAIGRYVYIGQNRLTGKVTTVIMKSKFNPNTRRWIKYDTD